MPPSGGSLILFPGGYVHNYAKTKLIMIFVFTTFLHNTTHSVNTAFLPSWAALLGLFLILKTGLNWFLGGKKRVIECVAVDAWTVTHVTLSITAVYLMDEEECVLLRVRNVSCVVTNSFVATFFLKSHWSQICGVENLLPPVTEEKKSGKAKTTYKKRKNRGDDNGGEANQQIVPLNSPCNYRINAVGR